MQGKRDIRPGDRVILMSDPLRPKLVVIHTIFKSGAFDYYQCGLAKTGWLDAVLSPEEFLKVYSEICETLGFTLLDYPYQDWRSPE